MVEWSSFNFLAWSSIAQSVCQQAFSLLEIRFQRLSGFESCIQQWKTTCLLSIKKSLACARASKLTTTNWHSHQPNVSGVEWAECSLIIGAGCRVQVFSLIFNSSVGLSEGIQSAGDSVLWVRILTTCLFSIRKPLACARASKFTTTNMCMCMCVCVCLYL